MNLELDGRRALVTGASRGIGRAIAERLIAEGCRVVLNARDSADLAAASSELHALAIPGDVTRPEDAQRIVEGAVSALGGLDILVCNVGSGRSVPPGSEGLDEWKRVMAVNLWSATNMVAAAMEHLARSSGAVVCVSSICGLEVIDGAPLTYSVAKAALNAYVIGSARTLAKSGVRINAAVLGNVLAPGSVWEQRLQNDPETVQTMLEQTVPLKRFASPREVADVVAYLASPRAAFVTGALWRVDGGQVRS